MDPLAWALITIAVFNFITSIYLYRLQITSRWGLVLEKWPRAIRRCWLTDVPGTFIRYEVTTDMLMESDKPECNPKVELLPSYGVQRYGDIEWTPKAKLYWQNESDIKNGIRFHVPSRTEESMREMSYSAAATTVSLFSSLILFIATRDIDVWSELKSVSKSISVANATVSGMVIFFMIFISIVQSCADGMSIWLNMSNCLIDLNDHVFRHNALENFVENKQDVKYILEGIISDFDKYKRPKNRNVRNNINTSVLYDDISDVELTHTINTLKQNMQTWEESSPMKREANEDESGKELTLINKRLIVKGTDINYHTADMVMQIGKVCRRIEKIVSDEDESHLSTDEYRWRPLCDPVYAGAEGVTLKEEKTYIAFLILATYMLTREKRHESNESPILTEVSKLVVSLYRQVLHKGKTPIRYKIDGAIVDTIIRTSTKASAMIRSVELMLNQGNSIHISNSGAQSLLYAFIGLAIIVMARAAEGAKINTLNILVGIAVTMSITTVIFAIKVMFSCGQLALYTAQVLWSCIVINKTLYPWVFGYHNGMLCWIWRRHIEWVFGVNRHKVASSSWESPLSCAAVWPYYERSYEMVDKETDLQRITIPKDMFEEYLKDKEACDLDLKKYEDMSSAYQDDIKRVVAEFICCVKNALQYKYGSTLPIRYYSKRDYETLLKLYEKHKDEYDLEYPSLPEDFIVR